MIETIKKLVAMKLGLAFVPEMSVQDEIQRGELVRIASRDSNTSGRYTSRGAARTPIPMPREFAEMVFAPRKTSS